MKKNGNIEKYAFSVLFLVGLFSLSGLSMKNTFPVMQDTGQSLTARIQVLKGADDSEEYTDISGEDDTSDSEAGIEDANTVMDAITACLLQFDTDISENVYHRYDWIEAYGAVSRALGKKEVNGFSYALDKNGAYNDVNF